MPELPEVETTCRAISPYLTNHRIQKIIVRHKQLRWPIPKKIQELSGETIHSVSRRGKYILISCDGGTLIIHLGMSGRLCITQANIPPKKHDHVDLIIDKNICLRYTDTRRFGAWLWTTQDPMLEPQLKNLGVEPLTRTFNTNYLWEHSRNRKIAIKLLIMDSHMVVGVGNIYANEALFLAKINPLLSAQKLSKLQCQKLVAAIKTVLKSAIKQGGTTLKDFYHSNEQPGYFAQHLRVYDRAGEDCEVCGSEIKSCRLGQRSTYYCEKCQR